MSEDSGPVAPRTLAIGDLHGEVLAFLRFLVAHGLVAIESDGQIPWCGGDDMLVQTGDIPDRGSGTLALARAIASWRGQGARIYTIAGNHDLPYILTEDPAERLLRMSQALPYMVNEDGLGSWAMDDPGEEYHRQAGALTHLHGHPDGGLVALLLDDVLFVHAEPNPAGFDEQDYAELATDGRIRLDPQRHLVNSVVFWGRAYTHGTADVEGGYRPATQHHIPPAREYNPQVLRWHEQEPAVVDMYDRLRACGVRRIVHGHVPGAAVRAYSVCGVEHVNIDEAVNPHYRMTFGVWAPDNTYVPRGWSSADRR